jgi:predicted phosphoadenosine phosphosulfate sulfurtransferase
LLPAYDSGHDHYRIHSRRFASRASLRGSWDNKLRGSPPRRQFDAALERIRFLFDEFPVVVATISGGKDSTVIYNLALRVAREKGRLPLPVFFIDQEAEWTSTIDTVREIMYSPDVKPLWFQMPIYIENATSFDVKYLKCWDPEAEEDWIHPDRKSVV